MYDSHSKGTLGGNSRARIYGRLDCSSALRAIAKCGPNASFRVFFADEATAIAAGYRPCGNCLRDAYVKWKAARSTERPNLAKTNDVSRTSRSSRR